MNQGESLFILDKASAIAELNKPLGDALRWDGDARCGDACNFVGIGFLGFASVVPDADGVSLRRMLKEIRCRAISTSNTLTVIICPALTNDCGSLINFSASAEMCTKPS